MDERIAAGMPEAAGRLARREARAAALPLHGAALGIDPRPIDPTNREAT